MAAVKDMLVVVLLGLCVAAGVVHGFVVDPAPGADSQWNYSDENGDARGGRLVDQLKGFPTEGFESYHAGVLRSADPAKFQSRGETDDVNVDNVAPYDYSQSSTFTVGPSVDRLSSTDPYPHGVSEQREELRSEYAHAGRNGATGAFVTNDVPVAHHEKALPAKKMPAGESRPLYVYNARPGKQGRSAGHAVPAKGHQGPVSYYTPSSNRHGPFVFYNPHSDPRKNLDSAADHHSDSSDSTSASTTPFKPTQHAPRGTHGCPNSYWAEHVGLWPAPLKITTLVAEAFGGDTVKVNLEIVYGTTTLFQALLDTRNDPYSKLLRHAVAALLNSHAKPAFTLRPAEVAKLFHAALVSDVAAAAQAQKFENENHAFGDNECK